MQSQLFHGDVVTFAIGYRSQSKLKIYRNELLGFTEVIEIILTK